MVRLSHELEAADDMVKILPLKLARDHGRCTQRISSRSGRFEIYKEMVCITNNCACQPGSHLSVPFAARDQKIFTTEVEITLALI